MTYLTKHNIPETQIIQLTGHRNLPSLNNYKKASLEQQRGRSALSGWRVWPDHFWGMTLHIHGEKKTDFGVLFINTFIANNDHIRKIMCYCYLQCNSLSFD